MHAVLCFTYGPGCGTSFVPVGGSCATFSSSVLRRLCTTGSTRVPNDVEAWPPIGASCSCTRGSQTRRQAYLVDAPSSLGEMHVPDTGSWRTRDRGTPKLRKWLTLTCPSVSNSHNLPENIKFPYTYITGSQFKESFGSSFGSWVRGTLKTWKSVSNNFINLTGIRETER